MEIKSIFSCAFSYEKDSINSGLFKESYEQLNNYQRPLLRVMPT